MHKKYVTIVFFIDEYFEFETKELLIFQIISCPVSKLIKYIIYLKVSFIDCKIR